MTHSSHLCLAFATWLAGCSLVGEPRYLRERPSPDSSEEDASSQDSTVEDTVDDTAEIDAEDGAQRLDQPLIDQPNPRDIPTVDIPTRDVPNPIDGSFACRLDTDCTPSWCGCGLCDVADIVCAAVAPRCNLGCPMLECPAVAMTGCLCVAGRCTRRTPIVDASVDVPSPLGEGEVCSRNTPPCAAGLLCCYPCGVAGCDNQCTRPEGGRCPMPP